VNLISWTSAEICTSKAIIITAITGQQLTLDTATVDVRHHGNYDALDFI